MERGVVKFFDQLRGFGFAHVLDDDGNQTDEEVFVHVDDGLQLSSNGHDDLIIGAASESSAGYPALYITPSKGEKIVFVRSYIDPRGLRAKVWCLARQWESDWSVLGSLDELVNPRTGDVPPFNLQAVLRFGDSELAREVAALSLD